MTASDASVQVVVTGDATGPAIMLSEPVSFWGGFDSTTGKIIDQMHPQCGLCLTDAVVFMRSGRGSSSASSVLTEAIRLGTAPAAFVLEEPDEILALGSIVGDELYGRATPIVIADTAATTEVNTGTHIVIEDGSIRMVEET